VSRKVVHVITELTAGGAEEMLLKLLRAGRRAACDVRVVSLTDVGPVGIAMSALGVPVEALGMRPGRPDPRALARIVALLRRERPDVVQTWMYHSDLLGGVAARIVGIPVVWGVRHDASRQDKPLTRATRRACALLSPWVPARVVFNSEAARRSHARDGYAAAKLVVIPNGFDLARFRPDPAARSALRRELGIPETAPVVALPARYHPDKDHATFVAAAARVLGALPAARFLLCGEGIDATNRTLTAQLEGAGLGGATRLLGNRGDVERVLAAADVACLSSRTESFPNAIGEAMACGVPCVATDCGDVRAIVGDTGLVVPAGDAAALGEGLLELLRAAPAARAARGAAARRRIEETYGLDAVARRFEELQDVVVAARR
jgi:glycosyltransferase involved in cell wall biosynthesis